MILNSLKKGQEVYKGEDIPLKVAKATGREKDRELQQSYVKEKTKNS